jgi:4-amino-4-deoxy-L-arabinose transferase-like glycosyltransferase
MTKRPPAPAGAKTVENTPDPLLLLLAVPVLFLCLGANSIWDANEAFYVETPRQMVLSGDYVNPSFNAQPRFNKPVLSYWIVASLYHVFGMSDPVLVERFGIAIGALGIVFAAFVIGRALRSTSAGVLAALIVITAPRFVMSARRIFIDVYLTLFLSLALACFVLALRHPERRRRYLLLMYVAIGLGVLTKGPVALALPAFAFLIWLVFERRFSDLRRLLIVPGAIIILCIVAPWYVLDYQQHGWAHIRAFFGTENLDRYRTAMASADRRFWFYIPVLLTDLFPWTPLVLVPLALAWRRAAPSENPIHASIRRLLWCWIVAFVAFFSFSATKLDLYIFPVTVAVAALIADLFSASASDRLSRAASVLLAVAAVLCVALAITIGSIFTSGPLALAGTALAAAFVGVAGLAALVCQWRGEWRWAVRILAAGFVAFNYVFVLRILPDAERLKPVPAIARLFNERAAPDARIASFNMDLPSLVFYTNHAIQPMGGVDQAAAFFRDGTQGWMILGVPEWSALQVQARNPAERVAPLCVAARQPLLPATVEEFVGRKRPPEAILVTSLCPFR